MSNPRPGDTAGSVQDHASRTADDLIDKTKQGAAELTDTASQVGRDQARKRLKDGKRLADDQLTPVQEAVDQAAQRLREGDSPLAGYASELSSQLSTLSSRIETSTVDDLLRDGQRVAKDNPGLFMLGAAAVGFAAARFLKASEQRDESEYLSGPDREAYEEGYRTATTRQRPYGSRHGTTRPYRRNLAAARTPVPVESDESQEQSGTEDSARPRINTPVNDRGASATSAEGAQES